jgi:hypothetical protein
MSAPQPSRETTIRYARNAARRAAIDLAVHDGAQVIRRPLFRGDPATVPDVEPLAGMRAAREIELGARDAIHGYIRDARHAGRSWHQIGTALGLVPGGDAQQVGDTVGEAAFTFAAGNPHSEIAQRYGRAFTWRCASCEGLIVDRGPFGHPVDAEPGHADGCSRLAETIAEWDAQWEAGS